MPARSTAMATRVRRPVCGDVVKVAVAVPSAPAATHRLPHLVSPVERIPRSGSKQNPSTSVPMRHAEPYGAHGSGRGAVRKTVGVGEGDGGLGRRRPVVPEPAGRAPRRGRPVRALDPHGPEVGLPFVQLSGRNRHLGGAPRVRVHRPLDHRRVRRGGPPHLEVPDAPPHVRTVARDGRGERDGIDVPDPRQLPRAHTPAPGLRHRIDDPQRKLSGPRTTAREHPHPNSHHKGPAPHTPEPSPCRVPCHTDPSPRSCERCERECSGGV